jgi:hypothetical protein
LILDEKSQRRPTDADHEARRSGLRILVGAGVSAAALYAILWCYVWAAGDTSEVVFSGQNVSYPRVLFGGLPPNPVGQGYPPFALVASIAVATLVAVLLLAVRARRKIASGSHE